MQGLPVVVYQDEDLETAAAGVVLVAQDGQLVAAHRHADRLRGDPVAALRGPVAHVVAQINLRRARFREGANRLFATMAGSSRSQLRSKANVVGSR